MTKQRLIQLIALNLVVGSRKKGEYLRKHNIFGLIGNKVWYQGHVIPLYPELIRLHDNVHIARNVHFETHDNINSMINFVYLDRQQMKSIAGMNGELSRGGDTF